MAAASDDERGRAAYEIYRVHRAEPHRFCPSAQLIPWESLNQSSQAAWVAFATGKLQSPEVRRTVSPQLSATREWLFARLKWRTAGK